MSLDLRTYKNIYYEGPDKYMATRKGYGFCLVYDYRKRGWIFRVYDSDDADTAENDSSVALVHEEFIPSEYISFPRREFEDFFAKAKRRRK